MTFDDFQELFLEISRRLLGEIVLEKLGYKKLYARWVLKILIPEHSQNCGFATRELWDRFEREGERFLDLIVIEDETRACHYTPESKRESFEWRHTSSQFTKKFKTIRSIQKVMATVF